MPLLSLWRAWICGSCKDGGCVFHSLTVSLASHVENSSENSSQTAVSACFIRLLSLWPATVHFPCHYSPQWRQTVLGCGSCHVSVQLFELSDETVSGEPRFRWHGSLGFSETERLLGWFTWLGSCSASAKQKDGSLSLWLQLFERSSQ